MSKICLLGGVDKRYIAYPLIRVLLHMGQTLVVTDDPAYRRFSDDYSFHFGYQNAEIMVVPKYEEGVVEKHGVNPKNFTNVLYISTLEIPDEADKVILCKGVAKGFATPDVEKQFENDDSTVVYVTVNKTTSSQALKIEPTKSLVSYVYNCEDHKEFLPTSDQSHISLLTALFEKELGLSKQELKGILQRKE